jgi:hypothetical protein
VEAPARLGDDHIVELVHACSEFDALEWSGAWLGGASAAD